jgi:hypothetical protein
MADRDFDINLILQAQVNDAAQVEQALDNLTKKTEAAEAASGKAGKAVFGLSGSLDANTQKSEKALSAISALNEGIGSGTVNFGALSRTISALSNTFGNLSMVAGALFAGIKAGLAIQSALWKRYVDDVKMIEPVLFKTRAQFDELNKTRLDALAEQVRNIQKETNAVLSAIDRAVARSSSLRAAEVAAERARIMEQEPAGPQRDMRLAQLDRRAAESDIAEREQAEQRKIAALRRQEAELASRIGAADADSASAQDLAQGRKARIDATQSPSAAAVKSARQAQAGAASAAEMAAKLRAELEPQIEAIREQIKDAETKLAIAPLQRAAANSGFAATSNKATADLEADQRKTAGGDRRAALQAELAALDAAAKQATTSGAPQIAALERRAQSEQGDVAAASGAIDDFRSGSSLSPRSGSYRRELARLESELAAQQSEAAAALAAVRQGNAELVATLSQIAGSIANVKSSLANVDN